MAAPKKQMRRNAHHFPRRLPRSRMLKAEVIVNQDDAEYSGTERGDKRVSAFRTATTLSSAAFSGTEAPSAEMGKGS